MIQNKFHYAITGQTAAEIIDSSANRSKEHMRLTTWKNAPGGRILKSDVMVAKNYLKKSRSAVWSALFQATLTTSKTL